jgi:hypothetical protein
MNVHLLINGIVEQTMVLIAQLATAGGIRAPLAQVADQVFLDLTSELQRQGVTKKVIADMFGMALRTYHRRERAVAESQTDAGRTVWDAVLEHIRQHQPISGWQIAQRFERDDPRTVSGVLHDMTRSGFAFRTGEGEHAVYRVAEHADVAASLGDARREASEHLVWLAVYRQGPIGSGALAAATHLSAAEVDAALHALVADARVVCEPSDAGPRYRSNRLDVPVGTRSGWEAAVLDHFQALVSTICVRLRRGAAAAESGGGTTFTFDVWPGHPLDAEVRGLLAEVRARAYALRDRVDGYNAQHPEHVEREPVVFYAGQYVKADESEGER